MADAFISYRRKPSAPLALLLQEKLKNRHGIDAYVDTTRADSTHVQFPERLMQAIADTPTFICLLGDTTLDSEWVGKEIQRAYELRKSCIPVFQESYTPPSNPNPAIEYLLSFDGVHIFDVKNVYVDEAVSQIAALVQRPKSSRQFKRLTLVGIGLGLLILIGIVAAIINGQFNNAPVPATQTPQPTTAVAAQNTATPIDAAVFVAQTPTDKVEPTQVVVPTTILPPTANFQATQDAAATAQIHLQTATAAARIAAPSPTKTTLPTKTLAPTIAPIQFASTPIFHNADWTPVEQNFDGVPMVLVPAGCFEMGNDQAIVHWDGSGWIPDVPGGRQCFEKSFWLDKYEVTDGQFQQFNGKAENNSQWIDADQPRETITWFEARDFCAQRHARLPTEAEWEYAASGPDNWIYPWGNDWNPDNGVWFGTSNHQTAAVGSQSAGMSWIGALDMSGNVWEWVSSAYQPYPYFANDGRENLEGTATRVVRGGSWIGYSRHEFRTAYRFNFNPEFWSNILGFRCARDIE